MEQELCEISAKMRECMGGLQKSEQQVYQTKKGIEQMLDKCLPQEETNEYDKMVFNPVKMNQFLDNARLLLPEIMQIRETLPPF